MKVIDVQNAFKHSDDGNTVNEYLPGKHLVSDRCALVAVEQIEAAKLTKDDPEKFAEKLEAEAAKSEAK